MRAAQLAEDPSTRSLRSLARNDSVRCRFGCSAGRRHPGPRRNPNSQHRKSWGVSPVVFFGSSTSSYALSEQRGTVFCGPREGAAALSLSGLSDLAPLRAKTRYQTLRPSALTTVDYWKDRPGTDARSPAAIVLPRDSPERRTFLEGQRTENSVNWTGKGESAWVSNLNWSNSAATTAVASP